MTISQGKAAKVAFRWLMLGLVLVASASFGVRAQSSFNIGVLGAEDSPLGQGAALIVEQINQQGGVEGADGTLFQLALDYVPIDEQNDITGAVSQLRQASVVAVIGPATAAQSAEASTLISELNVPILTVAADERSIINDTTDLLFRLRASSFLTERALADYLFEETGGNTIRSLQFDVEATISALGFANAYAELNGPVNTSPTLVNTDELRQSVVSEIASNDPAAVVTYGNVERALAFYTALREAGYTGIFAHPAATSSVFSGELTPEQTPNLISVTPWSAAAVSQASDTFVLAYVRQYGTLPEANAAAGADAVLLIAESIEQPGELRENLRSLEGVVGVQGTLSPGALGSGELSDNVYIATLNTFGVPRVLVRYEGRERLNVDTLPLTLGETSADPTATPDGVVATITSNVQNVRTGPSTDFQTIGQLEEGDQVQIEGATANYDWLVISFRGQQGWIANLRALNDVFGDLDSVPLITPPATPTPIVVPTATPAPLADIVIQSASVSPNPIQSGQSFTLSVTVGNVGRTGAGPFAVGTTLQPDNLFLATNVNGLAAGQSTTVNLNGTLNQSGNYSAVIVADLNEQVDEGPGETNNNAFTFNYNVQSSGLSQTQPTSGERIFSAGDALTLAGNLRIVWDGDAVVAQGDARVGILEGIDYSDVGRDEVNRNNMVESSVEPSVDAVVGVRSGNGDDKAVLNVVAIDGDQATIRFRVLND